MGYPLSRVKRHRMESVLEADKGQMITANINCTRLITCGRGQSTICERIPVLVIV
jgi:hypothetical protein